MQAGLPPDAEESAAVDTIDNHLTSAASLVSLLQHEVNVRASPSPCHGMLVQICGLPPPHCTAFQGMILAALLVVALYGSAHLLGHRFLSRSVLMWMNGTCLFPYNP